MQTPPAGRCFGRYVVESRIGLGGMGVVYAAVDTHLRRTVALKVVSGPYAASPDFRARFRREADTLARLDSPHVVTILDHGEVDGLPYLATQLVRGGDLGALLRTRGALPPHQALTLCAQVAEALQDAHEAGVVHRDVKPSNVLVRDPDAPRLHAYLCDFGIAQDETSDRLTTAGGVVGTWAYLAPERGDGAPATRATDIYSLGCLLWVCLTGQAPYSGTDVSVAMAHVNAPVRQLAGDDPQVRHLNQVLARAMAKDPAERYASARDLQAALVRGPAPPTVTPPSPTSPPTRPQTRRPPAAPRGRPPLLVGLVCALVLLLGAGGVAVALVAGDDDRVGAEAPPPRTAPPTAPPTVPAPAPDADTSVTADLDGDGLGDAVAYVQDGEQTTRYDLTSDGAGAFEVDATRLETVEDPVLGDFDDRPGLERIELRVDVGAGSVELVSLDHRVRPATFAGLRLDRDVYYVVPTSGDYTGDGLDDVMFLAQTAPRRVDLYVLVNTGAAFAAPAAWAGFGDAHVYTGRFHAGDLDGDGSEDLLAQVPTGSPDFDEFGASYDGEVGLQVLTSTGSGFDVGAPPRSDPRLQDAALQIGDFSGDGTPLVALVDTTTTPTTVSVHRLLGAGPGARSGTRLRAVPAWGFTVPDSTAYYSTARTQVSDVDGDGLDDLVVTEQPSGRHLGSVDVVRSTGSGFEPVLTWADPFARCRDVDTCHAYLPPAG